MNIQTLFILGAMVLFTTLTLSFFQKQNLDLENQLYLEAIIVASELGDSFLNEMTEKAFDENTVSSGIDDVSSLTGSYLLGPESGETTAALFDDIDDYDGYTRLDSLDKLGAFTIQVDIYYVDEIYPDSVSSSREYFKRIDFEISNLYLTDPIKFFHIIAY